MAEPQHNTQSSNNLSDRLIKIEVLLEQVLSELKKGDVKFEKIELRFEKTESRIFAVEKQQSYWQGALALLAIVWTAIIAFFK
jgi:septation ring formation regulator EzrA